MPAELRRAGSGLLRQGAWRRRELQRWRRGLLAEPDLASAPFMKDAARVQSESGRLNCTVPDEPDVCDDHAVGAVGSQ